MRDLRNRYHPALLGQEVVSFRQQSIAAHVSRALRGSPKTLAEIKQHALRVSSDYDRAVSEHLRRHSPETAGAVFAYSSAALATLRLGRERGMLAVLDQLDPGPGEDELLMEESQRWPGWENVGDSGPAEYWERVRAEWETASAVIVNSEFSRDLLVKHGFPVGKVAVVPLSFHPPEEAGPLVPRAARGNSTLKVLWVGSVILRKGIQYLFEAARMLRKEDIEFTVAGPIGISKAAVLQFPDNVHFLGKVSVPKKFALFQSADVFVLPTLSEGFAITQLEAMCFGLPVIATPNCGSVVTHGRDGFIVPVRDGRVLADRLLSLHEDRAMLAAMSQQALAKSRQYSIDQYRKTLYAELDRLGVSATASAEAGSVRSPAELPQPP
jgi:glycosyltransferase involved in cell wall biosynthesis